MCWCAVKKLLTKNWRKISMENSCKFFRVKQQCNKGDCNVMKSGYLLDCLWLGAFIASGGEPSVGSNIMDLTYRIQGWNFVHAQPPDLNRGLLFDCFSDVFRCVLRVLTWGPTHTHTYTCQFIGHCPCEHDAQWPVSCTLIMQVHQCWASADRNPFLPDVRSKLGKKTKSLVQ